MKRYNWVALIVGFVLLCGSGTWTYAAVQPINESELQILCDGALKQRSGTWNDDFPNLGVLGSMCNQYLNHLQGFAVANGFPSLLTTDNWPAKLREESGKQGVKDANDIENALRIRARLVTFAGSETVDQFERTLGPAPRSNMQFLFEAAIKRRPGGWTPAISSFKQLESTWYDYNIKLRTYALSKQFKASSESLDSWASQLRQHYISDRTSLKDNRMELALNLHQKLVDFAGNEAVESVEKGR